MSPLEARVLGVLVEKQATVPDTYPLSLNALVNGCNQKTAREPVIEAGEADVLVVLDGLKVLSLVFEGGGSRVVKYEHNMARALQLPGAAVALLAVLLLRGPQTTAELRLNCERLHRFADLSSVEGFLDELAAKEPARVVKLARAPGEREARWAQLLTGEPPPVAAAAAQRHGAGSYAGTGAGVGSYTGADVSAGEIAAVKAEQARLGARVEQLEQLVHRLASELGVAP